MTGMLYLDTSAFLKLYIREAGSSDVQGIVVSQHEPLPVWELLEMEFTNAFHLKVFWGEIEAAAVATQLEHFASRKKQGLYFSPELSRSDLLDRFRDLVAHTSETGCRTLDVLHVAAAMELGAARLISFDERQRSLAGRVGLPVQALD